jgi:hypothetical protein
MFKINTTLPNTTLPIQPCRYNLANTTLPIQPGKK